MNAATLLPDGRDTRQGVLSWRQEQLEAAGYAPNDARQLAERTDIDLHQATDLLHNGCATDTALRILL